MGLDLILVASTSFWLNPQTWYFILLVLLGLGLVIFVHELGHFAVAKLCGVKCEKFYLGFDIFGLKFCKFTWGETEYGIGILPLGGYVKMLGQEDNPARLREELQRAKAQRDRAVEPGPDDNARGDGDRPDRAVGDSDGEKKSRSTQSPPIDIAAAEQALFDPRSYLAQSVPKRMAIISAGVIMNVIFAFVCALLAYRLGVFQISCGVGALTPGQAAWKAGLRVDDDIQMINNRRVKRFSKLQQAISVGEIDDGVPMVIHRPGVKEPVRVTVVPDRIRPIPTIGISNPLITKLDRNHPTIVGAPASKADPPFQGGDKVVDVNSQPVENYADYHAQEALHPEKTLRITVQRTAGSPDGRPTTGQTETVSTDVAPRHMRRFGLVMEMMPVSAVQRGSPADAAGVRPGDVITGLAGEPVEDPMTLPQRLRRMSEKADSTVELTLSRNGRIETVEVSLRRADWYEQPFFISSALSSPALGIAYDVGNRVTDVIPGSPAARAGLKPGDIIEKAEFLMPDEKTLEDLGIADYENPSVKPFKFDAQKRNWAYFIYVLQELVPGTRVRLTLAEGRSVEITPEEAEDWFHPDRGFLFQPKGFILKAESLGEAISLGMDETSNALTMVFQFLHRLGTQQVSARALGGPVSIAKIAYYSAAKGFSDLLIFLCLISANLAVINFLPIPVLDGGHMVFLAYEGIRGKPPSERVYVTLSYMGLIFILGLMMFVFALDFGWIPRE